MTTHLTVKDKNRAAQGYFRIGMIITLRDG